MDTLVRMNAEEINLSFIEFIKSSFKGKKIAVHIYEEDIDETGFLLQSNANAKRLYESIENVKDKSNLKEFSFSDLEKIINENSK